jgi:hypothetical protein
MIRFAMTMLLCVSLIGLVGCDPNKELDTFYGNMGLTRLRYVRDDLQPGGLVEVGRDSKPIYKDNMFDYSTEDTEKAALPVSAGDRSSEYNAVLSSYTGDRSIDANTALAFLSSVLPIKLSNVISTSGNVTISMTSAKVQRMKIPTLNNFLGSPESEAFRTTVTSDLSSPGTSAYLVYEVFRTNKLKITTSTKFDFKPSVSVTKDIAVIQEGSASFELKRSKTTELEITGDRYYAFAIRTARLVGKPGNVLALDTSTKFIPKTALGGKEDIEYSRPIVGDFDSVALASIFASGTH